MRARTSAPAEHTKNPSACWLQISCIAWVLGLSACSGGFQTEPLVEDVEVVGPIAVKLFVSSTALDTDFTAKLIDVYPSNADYPLGFDLNIGDAITRMRYRNSLEKAELMKPGEVYEVTINLYPTANRFVKGHRIRLDISSSDFPRFDPNPNTGEPLQQHRRVISADNTVFHNAAKPSHVVLPIR